MKYWLMKSEPSEVSVDDVLAMPDATVPWFGVRNYLARNYMRDLMKVGDPVLFYHSSCPEPGIAGIGEVASSAYPDDTQFDADGKYYDPKATQETPRWMLVDVKVKRKTRLISLVEMRETKSLDTMIVLQRGNRLSITPVTVREYQAILKLAG
ncbi:MAG: EVE domain-containing protein [Burkholderiaceae bacterium]